MAAEIADRAGQAQELRDMQENYRKRKQEIQDQGEQDLEKTRADVHSKIRRESQEGDATVNHIKQESADRAEAARKEAESKTTYQRKDLAQKFQSSKLANAQSLDNLNQSLTEKQAALARQEAETKHKEDVLFATESEATRHIQIEQQGQRQEVIKASQKDVADLYTRTQQQKAKISAESAKETTQQAEMHRKTMEQLRDEHQKIYTAENKRGESQLKAQITDDQKRLENERLEFNQRQRSIQGHAQETLKNEQTEVNERMQTITAQNDSQVAKERQRGVGDMEQTRNYYDKQIAHIHKEGDEGVHSQKATAEYQVNTLRAQNKAEIERLKAVHQDDMKDTDKIYKERAQQNESFYKEGLLQQRQEFVQAHNKNQVAFEEEVRLQKANLAKSLVKEKREVMDDVGKFHDRQQDPFYHLTQVQGKLEETPTHYIVTAEVPPHEKDNVKVVVHNDRIIVQGHRRFEDQVKDENGQVSTENYQSFHETIPLEHPVHEKYAQRSYKDGVMTVSIPKA